MEEIIKQIIEIDSIALNTKKCNEEALKSRQAQYEKEIDSYREEKIKAAKKRAHEIYEQIVEAGISGHNLEEEKCKKNSLIVENRYLQIEEELLKEVLNELLGMEG